MTPFKKPISKRADYNRLPVHNPAARQRERLATLLITLSYIAAFSLGALCYALFG